MFKIHKKPNREKIPRTISFTDDMFKTLKAIADHEGISLSSLVLQCCQYAMDNYDKEELEKRIKELEEKELKAVNTGE